MTTMLLTLTDRDPQTIIEVGSYDLVCDGHIPVATLSWAAVPHPVRITSVGNGVPAFVWTMPYQRSESGLLVECGILDTSDPSKIVISRVFNLTIKPIRIKPGTLIARMFCVAKE